jgi:hypothetical protein
MKNIITLSNIKKIQKYLTTENINKIVKVIKYIIPFCKCKKSKKINPNENTQYKTTDDPIIIQFYDDLEIPHEIKIFNKTRTIEIYNTTQPNKDIIIYDKEIYKYENFNNIFIDINNQKYGDYSSYKYKIKLSDVLYIYLN